MKGKKHIQSHTSRHQGYKKEDKIQKDNGRRTYLKKGLDMNYQGNQAWNVNKDKSEWGKEWQIGESSKARKRANKTHDQTWKITTIRKRASE